MAKNRHCLRRAPPTTPSKTAQALHSDTKSTWVHDEKNSLSVGDKIIASACRPLSARKRFTLADKVGTNAEAEARRAKAESFMSAEDKEKVRIEQLVKDENC